MMPDIERPKTVTIPTATAERVLTALAQQPLGAVFDVFVELKNATEKSVREQQPTPQQ